MQSLVSVCNSNIPWKKGVTVTYQMTYGISDVGTAKKALQPFFLTGLSKNNLNELVKSTKCDMNIIA